VEPRGLTDQLELSSGSKHSSSDTPSVLSYPSADMGSTGGAPRPQDLWLRMARNDRVTLREAAMAALPAGDDAFPRAVYR